MELSKNFSKHVFAKTKIGAKSKHKGVKVQKIVSEIEAKCIENSPRENLQNEIDKNQNISLSKCEKLSSKCGEQEKYENFNSICQSNESDFLRIEEKTDLKDEVQEVSNDSSGRSENHDEGLKSMPFYIEHQNNFPHV